MFVAANRGRCRSRRFRPRTFDALGASALAAWSTAPGGGVGEECVRLGLSPFLRFAAEPVVVAVKAVRVAAAQLDRLQRVGISAQFRSATTGRHGE
jgi:hypothetical protein